MDESKSSARKHVVAHVVVDNNTRNQRRQDWRTRGLKLNLDEQQIALDFLVAVPTNLFPPSRPSILESGVTKRCVCREENENIQQTLTDGRSKTRQLPIRTAKSSQV